MAQQRQQFAFLLLLLLTLLCSTRVSATYTAPCYVDLKDGTELAVSAGEFHHPDFCNKKCRCTIEVPDEKTGYEVHSVECGCKTTDRKGNLQCFEGGQEGMVEGSGWCKCIYEYDTGKKPLLQCGLNVPLAHQKTPVVQQQSARGGSSGNSGGSLPEKVIAGTEGGPATSSSVTLPASGVMFVLAGVLAVR